MKIDLIHIVIILYMSENIKRNTRALQTTYDNYKNRFNTTGQNKHTKSN